MAQSLANLHVHLIFSTKNRQPLIQDEIRDALHGYMASVLNNLDCRVALINSVEDHVHILFDLARTVPLSKTVEHVKRSSSKWLKTQGERYAAFAWQAGYGAFAVSESSLDSVRAYIQNQREHHRRMSFQDEYRAFLERHNISFDEHYVWD